MNRASTSVDRIGILAVVWPGAVGSDIALGPGSHLQPARSVVTEGGLCFEDNPSYLW